MVKEVTNDANNSGVSDSAAAAFTCDFGVDIDPTRSEFNPLAVPPAGTPPVMRFTRRVFDISAGMQTSLTFP